MAHANSMRSAYSPKSSLRFKLADVDVSRPFHPIEGVEGHDVVSALVRWHNSPIGRVDIPVTTNACSGNDIAEAAFRTLRRPLLDHLLRDRLLAREGRATGWRVADLLRLSHPRCEGRSPPVSVIVCTRDRPADLARCLPALVQLNYPAIEVIVVDNAPSDSRTAQLVRRCPSVRYVCEPRPGLDWARNRGIAEAKGDIVAFTDDDAVVDEAWANAIAAPFAGDDTVMAVTGLVMPLELQTDAQILFERLGGFGRGFVRKWYRVDRAAGERFRYHFPWVMGTGANMAFRRRLFAQIGGFDPALDVGTVTNGGGDLEMFFRVVKEGHTLLYEPAATVFHRHRHHYDQLRTQVLNNGMGLSAYCVRSALAYPEERLAFARRWLLSLPRYYLREWLWSFVKPGRAPRELLLTDLHGRLIGLTRYHQARRAADRIADTHGTPDWPALDTPGAPQRPHAGKRGAGTPRNMAAERAIDLEEPLSSLDGVSDYTRVRLRVSRSGRTLGQVEIANGHAEVSALRLADALVDQLGLALIDPAPADEIEAELRAAVGQNLTMVRCAPS